MILKMMKLVKQTKIWMVLIGALLFIQQANSQTVISASIDSSMIMIGEQTLIHLDITTGKDQKIQLPLMTDTIITGIVLLQTEKPDTIQTDNNRLRIRQDYLITSFDSALYVIPPLKVIDGQDTLYSNSLVLKVMTFPDIDTEQGFFDIKTVLKPDFVLADYYVYIWSVLGALFLICAVMYILQKRKKKEPIFSFIKSGPKIPPHIEAMSKLDKIKVEKLWQYGRNKEYYSEITEVLRKYIMDRFGINALEMTSDEILSEIYRLHDAHSVYDTLKQVLELADLAKFAKYAPESNENEVSILNAYLFVNQTKIEEIKQAEGEEENPQMEKTSGNNV